MSCGVDSRPGDEQREWKSNGLFVLFSKERIKGNNSGGERLK